MTEPPCRNGDGPGDSRSVGMGSRLVRALAAQLGGHVETTSQPGGGTRHVLRFPVQPPGNAEYVQLHN
jgi:two-component sensor histidine kinase